MPTTSIAAEELPPYLLPTSVDATPLSAGEIEELWAIVKNIAAKWAPDNEPLHQRSQWAEFLKVRIAGEPSYLAEYRNGLAVLAELRQSMNDDPWEYLFFRNDLKKRQSPPRTRLDHFQTYVVDEFIRVWLATGGFKAFGAKNYNGFVSGSRFAVTPPYSRITKTP